MPTPETTPNSVVDTPGHNNIPKSLQPLLSFPLDNKNQTSSAVNGDGTIDKEGDTGIQDMITEDVEPLSDDLSSCETKDGVSNQAGKSCILLNDKSGTFRYMGETSPLSVLYETRNVFYQYVGLTKLTEDLRGCPVTDKPLKVEKVITELPSIEDRDLFIQQFKRNINDTFFVYNIDRFYKEIVEPVYQDPLDEHNQTKLVQLYFVMAIGATYYDFTKKIPEAPLGAKYFNSGRYISQLLIEDSELWCVVSHYLQFHYYQSILKKSTAWIHLNTAIKYAQSLGLHRSFVNEQFAHKSDEIEYRMRLFRSLYSSDRISSVFIGRPIAINDYDWDDPTRFKPSNTLATNLNFNAKCQIEVARVSTLVGKIVANFYQNRIIDINRTKNLAVQLKAWSANLDPVLKIESILKPLDIPNNEDFGNTQIVLMMHLLQLYAIMLLSRPFFMFEAVSNINKEFKNSTLKDRESSKQFCRAAVKASILAIKLMNHYINTAFKEVKRMECYVIITCSFYSCIFIGITILNGGLEDEGYTESDLLTLLKNSVYVLHHYSTCNKGAERYAEIGADLVGALVNRHNTKRRSNASASESAQTMSNKVVVKDEEYESENILNLFQFGQDPTGQDIQSLVDFQQLFVSHDIASAGGSVGGASSMPYDYGNYDLFFGDKY